MRINAILIPILFILIIFLGAKEVNSFEILIENKSIYWIISCLLYACYNSISLIPILITMKKCINSKKEIYKITIYVFLLLLFISIIIYMVINKYKVEMQNIEIPIVYIASKLGIIWEYIYGTLILIAIFTTAISTGYGFLKNIAKTRKQYLKLCILMCSSSILFSQISFSNLIKISYPIFGFLEILQIFFLLTA